MALFISANDAGIIYGPGGPIVASGFVQQNRGDFLQVGEAHGQIAELLLNAWSSVSQQIDVTCPPKTGPGSMLVIWPERGAGQCYCVRVLYGKLRVRYGRVNSVVEHVLMSVKRAKE